jgi:hypothetical protein
VSKWTCDLCDQPHIYAEPTGRCKTICCEKEVLICCGNNLIAHAVAVEHEQEHLRQWLAQQAELAAAEKLKKETPNG